MAGMQGAVGMFSSDEIIKGGMLSYAFEHFEIAAFRNLIEAARLVGDRETMAVCERILPEEQAMADWLQHNLASVSRRFLELAQVPGARAGSDGGATDLRASAGHADGAVAAQRTDTQDAAGTSHPCKNPQLPKPGSGPRLRAPP